MESPDKRLLRSGIKDKDVRLKHPVFQDKYEILSSLGEGKTSKVYLCRSIEDPKKEIALKLLRAEFLESDKDSVKSVEREIKIL